jgi:hypothetical protein
VSLVGVTFSYNGKNLTSLWILVTGYCKTTFILRRYTPSLPVVFAGTFMVKLEREDADAKVPTKVINTDIDAMIIPMAINILLFI